ncbi:hypothetical protein GCM10009780_74870 [Actinomadura alba]
MPDSRELANAVTVAELAKWKLEFETVCGRFEGRWYRTESREHFRQYLRGLLAPLARKNSWTISEGHWDGSTTVRSECFWPTPTLPETGYSSTGNSICPNAPGVPTPPGGPRPPSLRA